MANSGDDIGKVVTVEGDSSPGAGYQLVANTLATGNGTTVWVNTGGARIDYIMNTATTEVNGLTSSQLASIRGAAEKYGWRMFDPGVGGYNKNSPFYQQNAAMYQNPQAIHDYLVKHGADPAYAQKVEDTLSSYVQLANQEHSHSLSAGERTQIREQMRAAQQAMNTLSGDNKFNNPMEIWSPHAWMPPEHSENHHSVDPGHDNLSSTAAPAAGTVISPTPAPNSGTADPTHARNWFGPPGPPDHLPPHSPPPIQTDGVNQGGVSPATDSGVTASSSAPTDIKNGFKIPVTTSSSDALTPAERADLEGGVGIDYKRAAGTEGAPAAYTQGSAVVDSYSFTDKKGREVTITDKASGARVEQVAGHSAYQISPPTNQQAVNNPTYEGAGGFATVSTPSAAPVQPPVNNPTYDANGQMNTVAASTPQSTTTQPITTQPINPSYDVGGNMVTQVVEPKGPLPSAGSGLTGLLNTTPTEPSGHGGHFIAE